MPIPASNSDGGQLYCCFADALSSLRESGHQIQWEAPFDTPEAARAGQAYTTLYLQRLPQNVRQFTKASENAGLEGLRIHDLRHLAAPL